MLCEGALRRKNTRELYSNNLRAVGPTRSVEDETEQKTRQQNKTHGSKQGKQIINQNILVLTPLIKYYK